MPGPAYDIDMVEAANELRHHAPPDQRTADAHELARSTIFASLALLAAFVPAGRDKTLMKTHLEDSLMRANRAIAINGGPVATADIKALAASLTAVLGDWATVTWHPDYPSGDEPDDFEIDLMARALAEFHDDAAHLFDEVSDDPAEQAKTEPQRDAYRQQAVSLLTAGFRNEGAARALAGGPPGVNQEERPAAAARRFARELEKLRTYFENNPTLKVTDAETVTDAAIRLLTEAYWPGLASAERAAKTFHTLLVEDTRTGMVVPTSVNAPWDTVEGAWRNTLVAVFSELYGLGVIR